MKLAGLLLALIAGAHALPVTIEHGHSPVPERAGLTGLMEAAPDADTAADQLLQHYQKHGYPAVGVVSRPGELPPPASRRTGRDTLASSGSHHPVAGFPNLVQ
jgi:hypothetical protein